MDDTFDFMHRDSRRRQRVDSDASSFYFRPPAPVPAARPRSMHVTGRTHRRNESGMSIASMAPPVSLYNRGFGAHARHRRPDSVSSIGSSVHRFSFGSQRMSWGPHPGYRAEHSMGSPVGDFSPMRVARPDISGDKMMESAQGMPLAAISASPPESLRSARFASAIRQRVSASVRLRRTLEALLYHRVLREIPHVGRRRGSFTFIMLLGHVPLLYTLNDVHHSFSKFSPTCMDA